MKTAFDLLILAIEISPLIAIIAAGFLGWFFWAKDHSWVSKWWFIVAVLALLASVPTGLAAYRRLADLPSLPELTLPITLAFLVTVHIPTIIAAVVAYHYFILGRYRRVRMTDKQDRDREIRHNIEDAARNARHDATDAAREVKLNKQDAAREVARNAEDTRRERKDDRADIVREVTRNGSDEVREEDHAKRLKMDHPEG